MNDEPKIEAPKERGVSGNLSARLGFSGVSIGQILAVLSAIGVGGSYAVFDRLTDRGPEHSAECETCLAQRPRLIEGLAKAQGCLVDLALAPDTVHSKIAAPFSGCLPGIFTERLDYDGVEPDVFKD